MKVFQIQQTHSRQGVKSAKKKDISNNFNSSYNPTLTKTDSVSFKGRAEIGAAKKIVHLHSIAAQAIYTEANLIDGKLKALFSANYLDMAKRIANIYKLKLEQNVVSQIIEDNAGELNKIAIFRKYLTWVPSGCELIHPKILYNISYCVGDKIILLFEKGILK